MNSSRPQSSPDHSCSNNYIGVMPHATEITNGNGDQIKLGTTGKISSLMSRELEAMKRLPHHASSSSSSSSSSRKKVQEPPVSIHCGYSPKRTHPRRNPHGETNTNREKLEKKKKNKRRAHIAEVVDIKCNNPMSARIKKLGFSKLSESII